jgi:hypothetical protein
VEPQGIKTVHVIDAASLLRHYQAISSVEASTLAGP